MRLRLIAGLGFAALLIAAAAVAVRALPWGTRRPGPTTVRQVSDDPRLLRSIDGFSLPGTDGRQHTLDERAEASLVVVAFVGVECPAAALYAPRLNELAGRYAPRGVAFLAIDSNVQDSLDELAAFAAEHALSFPLLKDDGNRVADQFGARRTPEVFVLDRARRVRYCGRIDDQFGPGFRRFDYAQPLLANAIDDLLAGRRVRVEATEAAGCLIGRASPPAAEGEVTWCNQISRLVQTHCQECHREGQIGPFSLASYDDAYGWKEMMLEVVNQGRMPPWHANPAYGRFANDCRLTAEEKNLLAQWVRDGAPEGDPSELPPPRQFPAGWPIGQPDEIIPMSDRPFTVLAHAKAKYEYFFVDPGWKEDRWIEKTWSMPGNPRVVHHINVYFKPPWQRWNEWLGGAVNLISGYLPGQRIPALNFRGTAMYIPAGSQLVFEMHYTPTGREEQDLSLLGLSFVDGSQVEREFFHICPYNDTFVIPPGDPNHRVECWYTFEEDVTLEFLCPHMHLRGKDFLHVAHYPDGRSERLLEILGYDYMWQTVYWLAEPKPIPKGTRVHCVAHFDNSPDNPRNPDPSATVRWNGVTTEEMMVATFGVARQVDRARFVPGKTLPDGSPQPPPLRLSPADELADRGLFQQNRGEFKGAVAQYALAARAYWSEGRYATAARVWLGMTLLKSIPYLPWIIWYAIAINVLAGLLQMYQWAAARLGLPRLPWPVVPLVAAAGGCPAALVGQWLLRWTRARDSVRVRLTPVVGSHLVGLGLFLWFLHA